MIQWFRWFLRVAGCFCFLQLASGAATEDDVCSAMQTRRGDPSKERKNPLVQTAINAEALDRLVARTNNSEAFSETFSEEANQSVVLDHVQNVKDWFNSRPPEVQVLMKAVCISLSIAASLGLLCLWCGILRFHSPSKYISWKSLAEMEAGGGCLSIPLNMFLTLASVPASIMHLNAETRRSMGAILVFFAILFAIMWKGDLIQPVIKELASYLYVFALVGAVCVVVLIDLWRRAHATFTGTFAGLRRMQQEFAHVQQRLGLQDPEEQEAFSTMTVVR